jgi:integral membrane sensor domain MASE1
MSTTSTFAILLDFLSFRFPFFFGVVIFLAILALHGTVALTGAALLDASVASLGDVLLGTVLVLVGTVSLSPRSIKMKESSVEKLLCRYKVVGIHLNGSTV